MIAAISNWPAAVPVIIAAVVAAVLLEAWAERRWPQEPRDRKGREQ